jgi:hypothetical protein
MELCGIHVSYGADWDLPADGLGRLFYSRFQFTPNDQLRTGTDKGNLTV